jgi:hypothetical protein
MMAGTPHGGCFGTGGWRDGYPHSRLPADPFPGHTISPEGANAHQAWAEQLPRDSDPAQTAGFLKNAIAWNGDQGRGDVADLLGRFQAIDPDKATALQDELHRQLGERSTTLPPTPEPAAQTQPPASETPPLTTGLPAEAADTRTKTDAAPTTIPPGADGQFNLDKFGDTLNKNAYPKSKKECATQVRKALQAGGLDATGHPVPAKDWGPTLEKNGFDPVDEQGYRPQKGDVVVIQPYPGGDKSGHIAAYDGKQWISDFKQRDMWGGQGYRTYEPSHVIYRRGN